MLDVSVVVSTFGDPKWKTLAEERAIPSVPPGIPVIYNHRDTLHEARNAGLYLAETEYVAHLDADDELEPGFFQEISKVKGDVIAPSIRYITKTKIWPPVMPKVAGHQNHVCVGDCLKVGNWIIVGAVARTELLHSIGGWKDYANLEDYDLWMRCWLAGAEIAAAPLAVYRAHFSREKGRNTSMPAEQYRRIHYDICKTNMPDEDWEWLLK